MKPFCAGEVVYLNRDLKFATSSSNSNDPMKIFDGMGVVQRKKGDRVTVCTFYSALAKVSEDTVFVRFDSDGGRHMAPVRCFDRMPEHAKEWRRRLSSS